MKICIPVLMGLEAVVGRELERLGFDKEDVTKQDGLVYLEAPADREELSDVIAKLNVNLAAGERVMLEVARGDVRSFDDLFDLTQIIPWERFIPEDYPFTIQGYTINSQLSSVPACQRTIKKGQVVRLREARGLDEEAVLPEDPSLPGIHIQFALIHNEISFRIDTSGSSLHKRGYRLQATEAPIKETLAAGMLELTRWSAFADEAVWDPFCGSGTLIIEAALHAAGLAPGARRRFTGERWPYLEAEAFDRAREEALNAADMEPPEQPFLIGTDVDPEAIEIARINAKRAGVDGFCRFEVMDIADMDLRTVRELTGLDRIMIFTNPPYGERIGTEEEVYILNRMLASKALAGGQLKRGVRLFAISANDYFEKDINARADKRRKLYNGMIKCTFFQYFRRPKREQGS